MLWKNFVKFIPSHNQKSEMILLIMAMFKCKECIPVVTWKTKKNENITVKDRICPKCKSYNSEWIK